MCGSKSREEATIPGYPSSLSVARAINTWVAMHAWSLGTIAEASAHAGNGVDYALENQCAIVFMILSRDRAPGALKNPAEAFILEQGGMVNKDERSFLRAHWPRLERTCKTMADSMRATLNATERRAFAGFIPAAFHFRANGLVAFHQYPLFRLRAHGGGPSYENPFVAENNTLFNEVAKVLGLLNNHGLVLRTCRTKDEEVLLQACKCMQYKKSWGLIPAALQWDTRRYPGLSPTEVYRRYHKLLGPRNVE